MPDFINNLIDYLAFIFERLDWLSVVDILLVATIVFLLLYLLRDTNRKMMEKLVSELPAGARVVSRKYQFPGWDLVKEDPFEELYVYRIESG